MSGLDLSQFKQLIVEPALESIHVASPSAINLVTGTALAESALVWLKQHGTGPALGLFQMEPATHDDCWTNYLRYRPDLAQQIAAIAGTDHPAAGLMVGNLYYAAAMCRVKYLRSSLPLPPATDASALSAYHKLIYNTPAGAADAKRNTPLFQKAIDA